MSAKLSCCEINKKSDDNFLKCNNCECYFGEVEQLNDHARNVHKSGKRKMECCERNSKRQKIEIRNVPCDYCECKFLDKNGKKGHTNSVHLCSTCHQPALTKEIRAEHKIKHQIEQEEAKRQREAKAKIQREKDDDFLQKYVKLNKLDEYQIDADYEPNVYYIMRCHSFGKEELSQFVKKFEIEDIFNYGDFDTFSCEAVTYLLEDNAVDIDAVNSLLDGFTYSLGDDKIVSELVSYFLDKCYDIKREWIAKAINDDALMERIKLKYTFTFDEIYKAREPDSMYDQSHWDEFYVQVHKHFPNPDFEDPFADPFEHFKPVPNQHVTDHLQNHYFYDEDEDKLSIVVGYGANEREIELGSCEKLLDINLEVLKQRYNEAAEKYHKANDAVSKLFDEREADLDGDLTANQRLNIIDNYDHVLFRDAIPERNHIANKVSLLYFAIAKK